MAGAVLCLASGWASFAAESVAELRGTVVSALAGTPLDSATLELAWRPVSWEGGDAPELSSLDASVPLVGGVVTDRAGGFQLGLAVREQVTYVSVRVTLLGYEEYHATLVRLEAGQATALPVALVPRAPTAVERELLEARRSMLRDGALTESQWIPAAAVGAGLAQPAGAGGATPVAVPDRVLVELADFSGLMDLDEYIAGVVTRELGDSFHTEALRAQAVTARSYALDRLARTGKASGGVAYTSVLGAKSRQAALDTSKAVVVYQGRIITAYFSARCNGDVTLNSEEGPTLDRCWVGGLGVGVVPYCRARPCSGHINCSQTSERCCTVVVQGKTHHLYGHGIGLCQRGAQDLAIKQGLAWRDIVLRYYTAVEIQTGTVEPPPPLAVGDRVQVVNTGTGGLRRRDCASTGCTARANAFDGDTGRIVGGPEVNGGYTWWRIAWEKDGLTLWSAQGSGTEPWLQRTAEPVTRILRLAGDLAFGNVPLGGTGQRFLTLANDGNSPLTISGLVYPPGFEGDWSGTVPAGGSRDVLVFFKPLAVQAYSGVVTVQADQTSGTPSHAVSGVGTRVSPGAFDRAWLSRLPNGTFRLRFVGHPGSTCRLQTSTNLTVWETAIAFTGSSAGVVLEDPRPAMEGQRFYRVVTP